MKECASCPHRVEINPQYKEAKWEDLPCSTCILSEPMGKNLRYNDQFFYDPVDLRNQDHMETFMSMLSDVFRCWLQLDELERAIMADRVIDYTMPMSDLARKHKLSRVTLYKTFHRIAEKFPVFKTFVP